MRKIHKKYDGSRLTALFCLLLFFAAISGCGRETEVFSLSEEEMLLAEPEEAEVSVLQETVQSEESVSRCIVHICGAVKRPGVYELPADSRVMDAVTAGGGFLAEADQDSCNLASPVADGSRIYIMTEEESALVGEAALQPKMQPEETGTADGLVDINTADAALLKTLPGIGESRAAAILDWRREHGSFEKIEDIMKVNGIKQAAFDKLKEYITVK